MVDTYVENLARKIAKEKELTDVEIDIKPGSKKGDGFLGDILMVSIKYGNKSLETIFKCAMTDEYIVSRFNIKEVFENELHFYSEVVPAIQKFEKEHGVKNRFTAIAEYLGSHFENNIRIIALENLRFRGFELFDKKALVDTEHVEMVFSQYAKFHAFSFGYREQYPEEFRKLTKPFENSLWLKFADEESFRKLLLLMTKTVTENVEDLGECVAEKLKKYEAADELFQEVGNYKGEYSSILHGDCWSNNMMFRYKNVDGKKKLEDMCFLDWQICNVGTPVYDLSYFLYSSSSKEIFDNLDHYLKIYHDNLSITLREMGGDPDKLFPFSALKADWKKYCKFGFLLALLLQRMKLIRNDEITDLHDIKEDDPESANSKFLDATFDKELFEERTRNLVLHMNEIDAL